METIGQKVRAFRKKLDMTQEELSRKAEIPYATLMKIEGDNVKNPTILTIQKIAKALEVTVDEILIDINKDTNGNK